MAAQPSNTQLHMFNVQVDRPPVEEGQFTLTHNEDGLTTFSRKFALLDPYPSQQRGLYVLQQQFWAQWEQDGIVYRINVPVHVLTDVASIPQIVWSFTGLTPDGLYRNAALVHDMGYMWQGRWPKNWFQRWNAAMQTWEDLSMLVWRKDDVDRLFLRLMKACGVDEVTRNTMYWAVKLGGQIPWWQIDKSREQWRHVFDLGVPAIINA